MKKTLLIFLSVTLGLFFVMLGIGFFSTTSQKTITQTSEKNTAPQKSKSLSEPVISQKKIMSPSVPQKTSVTPIPLVQVKQSTPGPLVSFAGSTEPKGILQSAEVVKWTNYQREQNGVLPLKRNSQLDTAAIIKVHDMFEKQYFEHVSPAGKDAASLVTGTGYSYLWVGENLALGIFENEKDLVDAWMGSPGHRANILNGHYEEIGVAVDEGQFNGKHVWLAVQEFGKPSSSCPFPEPALKLEISQNQTTIASSTAQANTLTDEMAKIESNGDNALYNQKVAIYNAIVEALNPLILRTRALIEKYNAEIKAYNDCVGVPG
ncbi:MAG: CAP domain-containing protein [Candidatus Parcubacteria bacterium]|nr:CAP domain-containing protein [Candidatus Parcubacteria bacterium]